MEAIKKIIKKILIIKEPIRIILVGFGLTLFILTVILLFLNYKEYITTTTRLLEIFDINNLQNYFQKYLENNNMIYDESINEITETVEIIAEKIKNIPNLEDLIINTLSSAIIFLFDFINYFCNIGINVIMLSIIYYNETFNASNFKIKYSKGAVVFLKIQKFIHFIINKIKIFIKYIFKQLKKHKRKIALVILLILIGTGFLYELLTEILIFFITYIYHAIKLETYVILSSLAQALFLICYPKLKNVPYQIIIIFLLYIILIKAFHKANYRLSKNHERLKQFAQERLTQTTFLNGAPGIGKTLLNVSLTLASEENYIEELQNLMTEYEIKYPDLNFAKVRKNPENYPEHKEYVHFYEFLNFRESFIVSNYAIYSPYFRKYSKIFDFNYMRKNIKTDIYPLEEYIVISISELDKEYNSHDDMKAVSEDGAATFFSTTSHDLKRHVKIFCDYQLKDQVPLRIRGNSEYFLHVKKRKKKYPFLLYLYYLPFILASKVVNKLITKYEIKRSTITKKTKRKEVSKYKRNDYNLTYAILRSLAFNLNKICTFFDRYWYFKLSCTLAQEDNGSKQPGTKGESININLNICDLEIDNLKLFDSTFLSYAYEEKKNKDFKDLETFKSLRPTTAELTMCHSRFYDKLNGLTKPPEKNKNTKQTAEDEFIEI